MIIKKKLRDVTPSEYREWEKKHCALNTIDCANCAFHYVLCRSWGPSWVKHKNLYSDNFLDQEIEIGIKDVLDEVEKKYLKSIIRPFKDRVEYIDKKKGGNCTDSSTFYYIAITIKSITSDCVNETICFPFFKPESKMYEGMELNKEYTLKELGL